MKKHIAFSILILIIIILVGCAEKATEPINTETMIPTSPQETVNKPTPKPTLSEEQKKNNDKYNELLNYCKTFNDWNAAILIKDMFEDKQISQDQYKQIFSIDTFFTAQDFDEKLWSDIKSHVSSLANIINGNAAGIDEAGIEKFYQDLCNSTQKGTIYISLFDTQEKKDRAIQGVIYTNKWLKSLKEDFEFLKELLFSDKLSTGEKLLIYCNLSCNPGLPDKCELDGKLVDTLKFLNANGLSDYAE